MKIKIAACLLLAIILLAGFWFYAAKPLRFPFKCIGFVEYHLISGNNPITLSLSQDIRLFSQAEGKINFRGQVDDDGRITQLNRTLTLTGGKPVDDDTLRFTISRITRSTVDNTPEPFFGVLLDEYVTSQDALQLDLIRLQPEVWVIGSPASYLMTCIQY